MSEKKIKFRKKLVDKFVLTISSEDSMEEKFTIKLNRLNVFITIASLAIFLVASTTILISFTSIKEYIPGYDSSKLRRNAQELVFKTDSLEAIIGRNQKYIDNLSLLLSGKIDSAEIEYSNTLPIDSTNISNIDFGISPEDSLFRSELEIEDRFSVYGKKDNSNFVLISPLKGEISSRFNPKEKHYAIDISVEEGTPVKAVADGVVIFSEWTASTGNVVIIEHENNLISVYKHNATVNVEQADFVESGEVIASSGSTGELSTGPHLHYELWLNGYPVDPSDYIDFEL